MRFYNAAKRAFPTWMEAQKILDGHYPDRVTAMVWIRDMNVSPEEARQIVKWWHDEVMWRHNWTDRETVAARLVAHATRKR